MSRVAYVLGGCGFLGSHLVRRLLETGWAVGVVDPRAPVEGPIEVAGGRGFVARALVSSEALETLRRAIGAPARVYHLGGSGSVSAAAADPAVDFALTVESTRTMIEHVPLSARLVLVSSAAVYGDGAPGLISETHALAPISVYGTHKAAAEDVVRAAPQSAAIVRFFSLYGPGLRKQLLWDACGKLQSADARFAGTGTELRDWVHVRDAVGLLERVAELREPVVVNGGSGRATAVTSVLEHLRRELRSDARIHFSGEVRAGDPRSLVADVARACALGWAPTTTIEEGLAEYARWFTTC